jgi:hypothetical protein
MAEEPSVSSVVVASATPLPQAAGATLHWDDSSGVCGDVEPRTFSESVRQLPFRPGDRRHHAVSSAFHPAERGLPKRVGDIPWLPANTDTTSAVLSEVCL